MMRDCHDSDAIRFDRVEEAVGKLSNDPAPDADGMNDWRSLRISEDETDCLGDSQSEVASGRRVLGSVMPRDIEKLGPGLAIETEATQAGRGAPSKLDHQGSP